MQNSNFYCISSRVENSGKLYGCFKIGPFSENQSLTFANSLRRTLLADAELHLHPFIFLQIYGIEHEFSSIQGVRESVLDIIANLGSIRFQKIQPITKPKIAFLNFFGPGILQAKHIHLPSGFKFVQPSQYIATVEVDGVLMFKLFFSPHWFQTEVKRSKLKNLFLIHPVSIIEKVNYTIKAEDPMLRLRSNASIFFEVWTNGSLHPQKVILNAINKLLLEIFPYSQIISKSLAKASTLPFADNLALEKLLNLEISNFYFNFEIYLFFKKNKINKIIDFLNFVKKNKIDALSAELKNFYHFIFSRKIKMH
uniref:Plastid-encoded RNA polymerase subunit alpha n=1 Tax=Halimeda micronesica TaxID=170426 RepID=A0A386AXC2_9CHLO|nr:RNA polymerase a-subunit [Halimeda micronesica]